ncbi:MAG: hypothetical protein HFE04_03285 [Bacilli bacterium]|nr:hypothetical protein [Bacilli bacterium]
MINITTKELEMESELKKKIEFICDFCNTKPTIINGNIRNITRTNLSYVEPHRIIIKGITFLAFNYSKTLYINNLSESIELKDLETFIKQLN